MRPWCTLVVRGLPATVTNESGPQLMLSDPVPLNEPPTSCARALPQDNLGASIVPQLLARSESFVDHALRQHVTDLLLEVPMIEGRGAWVYVPVEPRQSRTDG